MRFLCLCIICAFVIHCCLLNAFQFVCKYRCNRLPGKTRIRNEPPPLTCEVGGTLSIAQRTKLRLHRYRTTSIATHHVRVRRNDHPRREKFDESARTRVQRNCNTDGDYVDLMAAARRGEENDGGGGGRKCMLDVCATAPQIIPSNAHRPSNVTDSLYSCVCFCCSYNNISKEMTSDQDIQDGDSSWSSLCQTRTSRS